jgi:16S rRNA (guanine527-N7)-methyltransferase
MTPADSARQFCVSRESLEKLETYAGLLLKWSAKINLVAPSTLDHVWERHFADSLQLIRFIPNGAKRIVDLGSGAGFPGLVLAIGTGCHALLVESNGKKAAFLEDVIRQTKAPAAVHHGRIENLPLNTKADVVTARALAPLSTLLEMASLFFAQGATGLFLKGQDVGAELTNATKYWNMKFERHTSLTDPLGSVLVVEEAKRVSSI